MREFGINTIAYLWTIKEGISQADLFDHAKSCGAKILEVRREYIKKEHLSPIKQRSQQLGMTVYYSVPEELLKNGRVNQPILNEVMSEAKIFDAKCVKFSLGDIRGVCDEELKSLADFVKQSGRVVLIENGPGGPEGDADLLAQFFKRQDDIGGTIGLTFDTGNFEAAGYNAFECAKRFNSRTRWIHLKDMKKQEAGTELAMLGEGDIDFHAIIPLFGSDIPIAIEYPCSSYEQVAEETTKAQLLIK